MEYRSTGQNFKDLYSIESDNNKMIKQEAVEKRDADQYLMQEDTYQPPVFNRRMEVKLTKILSNIKEKQSRNEEAIKEAKKGNPKVLSQTSNKCLIDYGDRPRQVLINTNDEECEPSKDLEMPELIIEFLNEYKGFTSNISAEQRGNIRQNIQHFLGQRKLSETHCRKILPQLSKQRFIYGVYFQDMIFDLCRKGLMTNVETQLPPQLRILQQHHNIEEALLFQQMPANIYFEQLGTAIERQYFPAYNTQQRDQSRKA